MNPSDSIVVDQGQPPSGDPCLTEPFSILRFAVLAALFLTMIVSMFALIVLADRPYGIQLSSMVIDSAAVALYTFSRNRGPNQPFRLSCPVVRRQIPQLLRRHLWFLAALFTVQTIALEIRPNLPAYWLTSSSKDPSPFAFVLGGLCGGLALVQILTNRSLLERAHISGQVDATR